jgi:hypothetical protein
VTKRRTLLEEDPAPVGILVAVVFIFALVLAFCARSVPRTWSEDGIREIVREECARLDAGR